MDTTLETTLGTVTEAVTDAVTNTDGSAFEPGIQNFVEGLNYMVPGMIGIFIVIGVIIISTVILNKVTTKKK